MLRYSKPQASRAVWLAMQLMLVVVSGLCRILGPDVWLTIASCSLAVLVVLYGVQVEKTRTKSLAQEKEKEWLKRERSDEKVETNAASSSAIEVVPSGMPQKARGKAACIPKQSAARKKVLLNNLTNFDGSLLKTLEGRPLAEPPAMDYEAFVRDELVPDRKLDVIFQNDPVLKTKFRDSQTERALLDRYLDWSRIMAEGGTCHALMRRFYRGLEDEIFDDYRVVREQASSIKDSLSPLIRWELEWLDDNGGTQKILSELENGVDVFASLVPLFPSQLRDEVSEKYGYVLKLLPHYPKHDIQTWEHYQLGEDGKLMKEIPLVEKNLISGASLRSTIKSEDEEYFDGHVSARLRELQAAELVSVRITNTIRRKIQCGETIFTRKYFGGEKEKVKYHAIASSCIQAQQSSSDDSARFNDLASKWPEVEWEDDCYT